MRKSVELVKSYDQVFLLKPLLMAVALRAALHLVRWHGRITGPATGELNLGSRIKAAAQIVGHRRALWPLGMSIGYGTRRRS